MAVELGQVGHAVALREVLPPQPVGVLVGAALPAVVRRGEVEACGRLLFDGRVVVEVGAVVRRDRPDWVRLLANQLGG